MRRLLGDRRGVATLEFALLGAVSLGLVFVLAQAGVLLINQLALDRTALAAARLLQTGQARPTDGDMSGFRAGAFCTAAAGLLDCGRVSIVLVPVDTFGGPSTFPPGVAFSPGRTGNLMLLVATYTTGLPAWPLPVDTITARVGLPERGLMRAALARARCRSRSGVVAIEFAFVAPVLVLAAGGLVDLTDAFLTWQRVTQAAQAISQIATSIAATAADTNVLTNADVVRASSAAYPYLPALDTPSPPRFGVTVTSLLFTAKGDPKTCGADCWTPHVTWSGRFQGTAGAVWACSPTSVTLVADDFTPAPNTLPADAVTAQPLLLVTVTYGWRPTFAGLVLAEFTMTRAAYLAPRTGKTTDWIRYDEPADTTVRCPEYRT